MKTRWGRLMEQRAAELLSTDPEPPTLVVAVSGGYRVRAEVLRSAIVLATPGAGVHAAVGGDVRALPFATGTFATVIDTSRPEEPGDHEARFAELLRVCRPGGTVATIASGGAASGAEFRSWAELRARAAGQGPEIVEAVPFDAFGMRSAWVLRDDVAAELESHLRFPAVRRAVRFLDRHLVAALPPADAGSVALRLRKTLWAGRAESSTSRVRELVASRPFARRVLELLSDDSVARFAAFLDTAILSPAGVPMHLGRWLANVAADPELAADARAGLLPRRLWWTSRRDVQRVLAAAGHRLAHEIIAVLAETPGARTENVSIPHTLEYDLVALFNRELGHCTEEATA